MLRMPSQAAKSMVRLALASAAELEPWDPPSNVNGAFSSHIPKSPQ